MQLTAGDTSGYLHSDGIIEADSPAVRKLAATIRAGNPSDEAFAKAAFEWVRDEIQHSWDIQDRRVTLTATQVLDQRVGICFAKSHLLTALMRAEGIPAGLCYQRLADGDAHVVHGLVAVHLRGTWHRQDPRGNKAGVDAQFSLSEEHLAWPIDRSKGEVDYPEVHAKPAAKVVASMAAATDALVLCAFGLPDTIE
jgi:transglutaminase-like putative cysteine protease